LDRRDLDWSTVAVMLENVNRYLETLPDSA